MIAAVVAVLVVQPWRSLPHFTEPSFAYRTARDKGLQGRILWIDGTANIGLVADRPHLAVFMKKAAEAGFNTVVYDVKPIIGRTLYPSRFAAPLVSWRGQSFPAGYDPLSEVLKAGHAAGLQVCVSMNAFSEGHSYAKAAADKPDSPFGDAGPGYRWPERQSVVLRHFPVVQSTDGEALVIGAGPGTQLHWLKEDTDAAHCDMLADGSVVAAGSVENPVAHLVGDAAAVTKAVGGRLGTGYRLVRSGASQTQIPLIMNPYDQLVRDHVLVMVDEVARHYAIDGLLFDDRLRFTGLDGDFSNEARLALEKRVGEMRWPEDVYEVVYKPDLTTFIKPGKHFQAWLELRAETLASFVRRARQVLKRARPTASFGVYAGSTYGHYFKFGNNYGSPDNRAGYPFLTPAYRRAGFAPSLDLLVTGCYYPTPTVGEALALDKQEGFTVEAAALVSGAAAYDATWTYAGVMLSDYKGRPEALETALRAATANSEGVMVFDASHGIDAFWPVFAKVFGKPVRAPHATPGLIEQVRRARAKADRRGEAPWNFPMLEGQADAGF